MSFAFRHERILRLREAEKRQALARVAETLALMESAEGALRRRQEQADRHARLGEDLPRAGQRAFHERMGRLIRYRREQARARLAQATDAYEEAREALARAMGRVQALEDLKGRRREEWQRDVHRREQRELDDLPYPSQLI